LRGAVGGVRVLFLLRPFFIVAGISNVFTSAAHRIALATRAAHLNAQFHELETLRDLVRKAQNQPWGHTAFAR
jgi:hypothetical protein